MMGMYYFVTLNLRVRPDAPANVHTILQAMCSKQGVRNVDLNIPLQDHPFIHHPLWLDMFRDWFGVAHNRWNGEEACASYVDGLLHVRCAYKYLDYYKRLVQWISPWLVSHPDNCVFYFYEDSSQEVAPSVLLGSSEAVAKFSGYRPSLDSEYHGGFWP